MHVILHPFGSHGDVHPFIGMGRALRARGHRVTLVTAAPFAELAERNALEFVPIGEEGTFRALMDNPELFHPRRALKVMFGNEQFTTILRESYDRLAKLYEPGRSVIVAGTLSFAAAIARDKLGASLVSIELQPSVLPSVVDPPVFPHLRMRSWWPHWFRRALYGFGARFIMDRLIGRRVNTVRQELGLPPISKVWHWRHSRELVLGLFPPWYANAPDWPAQFRPVGFVRYDQGESNDLADPLRRFLDAGPPPVIVTFGTAMRHARPYFDAAVDACQRLGARGLLLAKSGEQIPPTLPPTVMHADYAPFSLVFPRASVVIHHGGIGTTAQCLAAGVPQLIMPLAFDQPDNANRLERLGVGRTLYPKHFTGAAVAAKVKDLLGSADVATACQACAAKMRADDPVNEVCRLIESRTGTDVA